MKKKLLHILTTSILILSLGSTVIAEEAFVIPDPVAVIDGKNLSKDEFLAYLSLVTGGNAAMLQNAEQVKSIVKAYGVHNALANEAIKNKLDNDETFKRNLELTKTFMLAELALIDYSKRVEIDEKAIKVEYDKQVESLGTIEYKASHILVESREEAENLIKEIASEKIGFETAAEENSLDTGSAISGGDLGWFFPQMMVPEFSAGLEVLQKGEISKEPVESPFGFHIIKLIDSRDAKNENLKSYEDAKDGIRQILLEEKIAEYYEMLDNRVKIEYKF